ncbi:unnamed protein product [Meloidogyne enterolobii]|uniref:Uncharacterized protein n=1 Tax=Meloidogyne enterolobii TaxID=390850 RepID=A0ACB0ZQ74_MELEN
MRVLIGTKKKRYFGLLHYLLATHCLNLSLKLNPSFNKNHYLPFCHKFLLRNLNLLHLLQLKKILDLLLQLCNLLHHFLQLNNLFHHFLQFKNDFCHLHAKFPQLMKINIHLFLSHRKILAPLLLKNYVHLRPLIPRLLLRFLIYQSLKH